MIGQFYTRAKERCIVYLIKAACMCNGLQLPFGDLQM